MRNQLGQHQLRKAQLRTSSIILLKAEEKLESLDDLI